MSRRKSTEPLYKSSDKVLCNFHGQLYDAVILETKYVDILEKSAGSEPGDAILVRSMSTDDGECADKFAYYLHYANWNSRWDEWVRSDCLVAVTEEARQRQQELKMAARKEKNRRTSKKTRRRAGRKSVPSSSVDYNRDEDLAEGEDEYELMYGRDEHSGLWQAEENGNDSTKTSVNTEAEMKASNNNLSNDDSAVHRENSSEFKKSSKEKTTTGYNLLTPDESGAEGKEMKDPEKLGSSESTVEAAPVSGTTSSSTSFEVEERIKEGARPADDVSPGESTRSIAVHEVESSTENHHHLGEKVEKLSVDVLHVCSLIGTPTVNDIIPQLRDYMDSIDDIGNVHGFVEKIEKAYEDICEDLVHPSLKCKVEETMIKNGVSKYAAVVHFSGLVELLYIMESGEWTNEKYYKPSDDATFIFFMNLFREEENCKIYLEAARRFLLSKLDEPNHELKLEGSTDQKMTVSDENSMKSSSGIDEERPVACPSLKSEAMVLKTASDSPLNEEPHEAPGRAGRKRASLRRKCVNYN